MITNFSTFPGRLSGLALLLLRLTLGTTAIVQGIGCLSEYDRAPFSALVIALFMVFCGIFLIIGLFTPIVALALFGGILGTAASIIPTAKCNLLVPVLTVVYTVVTAAAVGLLGPGAFSLDALMCGRREIVIPGKSNQS